MRPHFSEMLYDICIYTLSEILGVRYHLTHALLYLIVERNPIYKYYMLWVRLNSSWLRSLYVWQYNLMFLCSYEKGNIDIISRAHYSLSINPKSAKIFFTISCLISPEFHSHYRQRCLMHRHTNYFRLYKYLKKMCRTVFYCQFLWILCSL